MFTRYIVWIVFIGYLVFELFFPLGVAFGDVPGEIMEQSKVLASPRGLPLLPLVIPVVVVAINWLGAFIVLKWFFTPILMGFSVALVLWALFMSLSFFYSLSFRSGKS